MLKNFSTTVWLSLALMITAIPAMAVTTIPAAITIPSTTPVYEPTTTITLPSQFLVAGGYLATGAQNIIIPIAGNDVLAFKFNGGSSACAGLNATVLGSLDNGATYTQLNVYPYPALGTAAPTILASGGPILYSTGGTNGGPIKVNVEGFTTAEISISALTGTTCIFSAAMGNGDFNHLAF